MKIIYPERHIVAIFSKHRSIQLGIESSDLLPRSLPGQAT